MPTAGRVDAGGRIVALGSIWTLANVSGSSEPPRAPARHEADHDGAAQGDGRTLAPSMTPAHESNRDGDGLQVDGLQADDLRPGLVRKGR